MNSSYSSDDLSSYLALSGTQTSQTTDQAPILAWRRSYDRYLPSPSYLSGVDPLCLPDNEFVNLDSKSQESKYDDFSFGCVYSACVTPLSFVSLSSPLLSSPTEISQ